MSQTPTDKGADTQQPDKCPRPPKRKFKPYRLAEPLLLPPDLQDWVPEGHLARFIQDAITEADLKDWYQHYETEHGRGQPPFPPVMMARVLIYCYCTGRFSSRKIESATYHDVAVRFLSADLHPDHSRIAGFRARHTERIGELLVRVIQLCRKLRMASLGSVAIDGTKLPANASIKKTVKAEDIEDLIARDEALVKDLLEKAANADAAGDEDETTLPDELSKAEKRLSLLRKAKAELDREAAARAEAETEAKAQQEAEAAQPGTAGTISLQELRKRAGLTQAQLAALLEVTSDKRLSKIERLQATPTERELEQLATALSVSADDILHRLKPTRPEPQPRPSTAVPRINTTDPDSAVQKPRDWLGSFQGWNAQIAVDSRHQIIVAAQVVSSNHDYDSLLPLLEQTVANCGSKPDRLLADKGYCSKKNLSSTALDGIDVYVPPAKGHHRNPDPTLQAMREKLNSPEAQAIYNRRAVIVEPVFAHIKRCLGFTRFLYRGTKKVNAEWQLVCTAHNLLKLFRFGPGLRVE